MNAYKFETKEFPLIRSSVEMKTVRIIYSPALLEYSTPGFNVGSRTGTNTNEAPSLLDKNIDKYREAWSDLAEL